MNIATILAAIINVILNWIFIPYVGFLAAAYTTLISYLVFEFISFFSYKKISERYKYAEDLFEVKALFFIQLMVLILGLSMMLLYKFWIIRLILIIVGGVVIYFNKNIIINFLKKIRTS